MKTSCALRGTTRRGFTFVELCIGLVVVSLVMGALAAFSLATADAWQQGATTNAVGNGQNVAAIPIIGTVACARLDNEISAASTDQVDISRRISRPQPASRPRFCSGKPIPTMTG